MRGAAGGRHPAAAKPPWFIHEYIYICLYIETFHAMLNARLLTYVVPPIPLLRCAPYPALPRVASRRPPRLNRSREQAPTPEGDGRGHNPAMVPAVTGPSSSGLGLNTPSTTHNSLQSSESAGGGVGLSGRTPGGRQFSGGGGGGGGSAGGGKGTSANGGLAVSVQSCHTESMSPPRGNATRTHQVRPFS